ncbi:MAG: hypothetical protein IJ559_06180 [Prevotella sp.]|nr:hypothetical protein [Prevotella sp.]
MKKRLLMFALAVLATATSFAYNEGDYAYNATQRFKIVGPNLVTNGNFANGRDGWYSTDKETSPSADVWDVVEGAGPNGETVIQSIAPTADQPFCNSWSFEAANTYVVSFDIKAEAAGFITTITGGSAAGENACDFFLNGDGAFVKAASTDDAPVTNVAVQSNYPAGEWRTLVFFFTADAGKNLVMHFEKLAAGIQFTNVEIHQAEQVYDIRVAQNRISLAKELMEMPEFNTEAAQEAKADLQGVIESIEAMIESGEMDDQSNAEAMMSSFDEEGLEPFLAVTSVDAKTFIPGLDIASLSTFGRGGIGSNSAKWKLFDGAGNWGHLATEQDVLRSAIQTGYDHQATYKVYHEDFPAGKYFFTCEVRNANTDKSSWPCNPIFNLKTDSCLMFISTDTIKTDAIEGEEFQRFSMVSEVKEDGKFYAGIYWPNSVKGGAFFVRNTIVRAFNTSLVSDVEHVQAFKTYMTQWNAATSGRQNVHNKIDNANYPWGQNELKAERDRLEPYYTGQHAKGWYTAEGTDAGVASTDELNDWALYQGIEAYGDPDEETGEAKRLEYQLVRGYQAANNAVEALNKVITDLGNAIDEAKKTRNNGAYQSGDRETYKAAILAALNTLTTLRAATTDATREADSTTFAQAKETLDAATAAFLASVSVKPFIDIDFQDPADPTIPAVFAEDTSDEAPAAYYIEGKLGKIYFAGFDEDNNTATGFALGVGEEYPDVLRVGNGDATVYIDEANQPGDDDCLRVTFDMFFGNLSGKNAGIELQNAAGERVAGFSINRYHGSLAYNDFNSVLTNDGDGLNLLKYVSGVGSSSASNAAIAAASNCSSFDLVIDYHNKTLQGTLNNAKNGICEGKAMPFRTDIEDQKVVKFVLRSNYNNKDRRCWFDNLKISKYALADVEEDITEKTWADHTDWVDTGVKSINNAAADKAIYTLSGVRVTKASKPGMYIQNGKKFVIK